MFDKNGKIPKKEAQEIIEGLITAVSHFDYLTNYIILTANTYNANAKPAVKDAQEFLEKIKSENPKETS